MTKREFLEELRKRLSALNDEDFASSVAYYEEMISDRMEDGLSEEDAVKEVGSPAEAASAILKEMPLGKLIKARIKPKHKLPVWAIVLILVGSPIWISLASAAISVVVSVYAAIWSVVAALWVSDLSFIVSGVAAVILTPYYCVQGFFATGFALLGAGLLAIGLSIFLFFGCFYATKGMFTLSKTIFLQIKGLFVRKEAVE